MFVQSLSCKYALFFVCVAFLFFECQKEEDLIPEPAINESPSYPGVAEELWPYFSRFEEEARLRGFNIDLRAANIRGNISDVDGENIAGLCNYHSHSPNIVTIDAAYWARSGDTFKEFVVFHELGHCQLGRLHREDEFVNGTCISIMRSGSEGCIDNYNSRTRGLYLNELFDIQFWDKIGQ